MFVKLLPRQMYMNEFLFNESFISTKCIIFKITFNFVDGFITYFLKPLCLNDIYREVIDAYYIDVIVEIFWTKSTIVTVGK